MSGCSDQGVRNPYHFGVDACVAEQGADRASILDPFLQFAEAHRRLFRLHFYFDVRLGHPGRGFGKTFANPKHDIGLGDDLQGSKSRTRPSNRHPSRWMATATRFPRGDLAGGRSVLRTIL